MITKVEGVVLSSVAYGETSKIINVYTKEYGLIGILGKGAMNIKSKIRPAAEKLCYGYFSIYYRKDKLSTLVAIDIINPFKNIKSDIVLISYATYICDLVNQVVKQCSDKKIYYDFIACLIKLDEKLNPTVISNILEVKLLEYLGIGLNLTSCILCGSKKGIVTLAKEKGGLICQNCYKDEDMIDLKVVKILNMYYLVDINSIKEIKIDKKFIEEIDNFLQTYYDDYTGLYLKSKEFLKKAQEL